MVEDYNELISLDVGFVVASVSPHQHLLFYISLILQKQHPMNDKMLCHTKLYVRSASLYHVMSLKNIFR